MTRDIYIRTKSKVVRYRLGKAMRPQTVVGQQLYRTDESLMLSDKNGDRQFVMYPIDGTVPYYVSAETLAQAGVSPDFTMAYNDISKQANVNPAKASNFNPQWILYGVIGIVVVYAVIIGGVA